MAVFHLHAKIKSRSKGWSAVAAAAYRAAARLFDERQGVVRNYQRKEGVEHVEILAPKGAPAWVYDREQLWNRVEAAENRRDAQVAREVQVALPVELDHAQQVELVRDFVNQEFVSRGMVADFAIHRDNSANPHVHILLTLREINEHGFSETKQRAWNERALIGEWRESWATITNRHLERAGHQVRIDHRSYKEQGIELTPMRHLGTRLDQRYKDGRTLITTEKLAEHERIVRGNGEAIFANPTIAIDAITRQRATFTRRDVGRWLNTHTADADQFQRCLDVVMAHAEVVSLGVDGRGQERFTSREMLQIERDMMGAAESLAAQKRHEVKEKYLRQAERARPNLSGEQLEMVRHVVRDAGDVAVVQGYAGAGKSYALGAAKEAWEAQGYRVLGAALAGKAAEGLEVSAGIQSRSLAAWEYAWDSGREELTSKDVLVIDEAGMVGSRQMDRVLARAEQVGAKVVLVGDARQLQAIEAGAPMRAISERVGQVKLEEIRRQETDWQREASKDLAEGNVPKALEAYERAGHIHEHGSRSAAIAGVVEGWNQARLEHPNESNIMLAFRRDEVRALNDAARNIRREQGELGADHTIETNRGARDFATGDRLLFLQNDRRLGVKNGSLATIDKIQGPILTVKLDGPEQRRIAFDARQYDHLEYGYAVTAHKAQGVTVERAHVLASELFDQHVSYVAMSRHRHQVDLHWSHDAFADKGEMVRQLSRERQKDVALDYVDADREAQELSEQLPKKPKAIEPRFPIHTAEELQKARREVEKASTKDDPPHKIVARGVELERIAKRAPLSERETFAQLPEVRAALQAQADAKRVVEARRQGAQRFADEHPMKVKLGMGSAVFEKLEEAKRELKVRESKLAELAKDPRIVSQVRETVKEHDAEISAARDELAALGPKLREAKAELKKELELKRERDKGLER